MALLYPTLRQLRKSYTGDDQLARLWEPAGTQRGVLRGHTDRVESAVFSPDGQQVLTASVDGLARVWQVVSKQLQAILRGHKDWVWSAIFSPPDGQLVVTASADETTWLWNLSDGQPKRVLSGPHGEVRHAAFSPDGQLVVTAHGDGTARLWDTDSGQERAVLSGHTDWVWSAVFSADGRFVVTASRDGTVRQYIVKLDDLLALATHRAGRELTPEERILYLGEPLQP